jgi:3-deoxy-D-manno-octulosonic-acid transferase
MNLYDLAYTAALTAAAPLWLTKPAARKKVLAALRQRMGHVPLRPDDAPSVLIHAVSLGEMNATRALVAELERAKPDLRFILSATTDTGFQRGQQLYGQHPRATVIRYPLDFTPAIGRLLDNLRPSVVALMELEVWPNFLHHCAGRDIPVALLNGRLTEKSYRNYRRFRPLIRPMFRRLARICAQEEIYAERFIELGADPARVEVTGTMKFDTAVIADHIEGDGELATAVGLYPGQEPIWVCGSTGPGEEAVVLDAYVQLLETFPNLHLVISPRKPERFDEVAELIQSRGQGLIRRSGIRDSGSGTRDLTARIPSIVLGDTMGELRKFYSLATVVFVGRTLLDLGPSQHGSDMIEPTALAKPTVVGPFTGNFAQPMRHFRAENALVEIPAPSALAPAIADLLTHRDSANFMARRAQDTVRAHRGATRRHAQTLLNLL